MVRLNPGLTAVWRIVRLKIVMHEAVVVQDTHLFQLWNELFRGRPDDISASSQTISEGIPTSSELYTPTASCL